MWLKRIRSKFYNNQKRKESSLQVVQEASAKFTPKKKLVATAQSSQAEGTQMYGMKNYLPEKPVSEDKESTERHIKALQETFKSRGKMDMKKVYKLMDLTFYKRREDIVAAAMSVATVLDVYPWVKKLNWNYTGDTEWDKNRVFFLEGNGLVCLKLISLVV